MEYKESLKILMNSENQKIYEQKKYSLKYIINEMTSELSEHNEFIYASAKSQNQNVLQVKSHTRIKSQNEKQKLKEKLIL